jgi:phosphohistidine phosphatase SixA
MKRVLAGLLIVISVAAAPVFAQPAVFLVRHAERADTAEGGGPTMTDPDLSAAGLARAESLATTLRHAKVTAIYTTEYRRTKQTAEPLAKALGLEPTVVMSKDLPGLMEKLKEATGNVLVVGHSNSVPGVIEALGVTEAVAIGDADYDNLFVVIRSAQHQLLRLSYR